ncbi:MAG: (2Fe-2S) ferredoxin domain-containing protein, partial [Planctomycetes bacterium]|nr:(2Fe-2S) ferredoxin domain-containing protein [Planctomycetota bacterium]
MARLIDERCCEQCWHGAPRPCPDRVTCLTDGPICHHNDACRGHYQERTERLRRERIERPAIFIGTGTCGLGAGAGKTLAAIRVWLQETKVEADIVEVGCIGLCTAEPIVDVQLPGRTRVSFCTVTAENVRALLGEVFAGRIPAGQMLGQMRSPGTALQPWSDVPYLDEHPFFAPQMRWVLANCGVIDPSE